LKILVTGGLGYLGGRISQSLIECGHQVFIGSRSKIKPPNWAEQARIVQLEWGDLKALSSVLKGIDVVVHAAGMNAHECEMDPIEALEFNGVATARLVQACVNTNVSKFIYLSTVHVYCSPLSGVISEDSATVNRHPYATSHAAGENVVLQQNKNFTGVVLRLSNCIGTPLDKNTNCWMLVVNDFCRQVIEFKEIKVNSSQKLRRDFVPISLLCDMISFLVDKKGKIGEDIINVSLAKTASLQEMVSLISERSESILGYRPKATFRSHDSSNENHNLTLSNSVLSKYIKLESSLDYEIDRLLLNCKQWFS
jgi:UDP-glucose 4-epimerase